MDKLIHRADGELVSEDPWAPGTKVVRTNYWFRSFEVGGIYTIALPCKYAVSSDRKIHMIDPKTGICEHPQKMNFKFLD